MQNKTRSEDGQCNSLACIYVYDTVYNFEEFHTKSLMMFCKMLLVDYQNVTHFLSSCNWHNNNVFEYENAIISLPSLFVIVTTYENYSLFKDNEKKS